MDLVSNPTKIKVVVVTEHIDKKGNAEIVPRCAFPLTGKGCVSGINTDLVSYLAGPTMDWGIMTDYRARRFLMLTLPRVLRLQRLRMA